MPDRKTTHERKVSLFRNGRSQAVRIPKEFELPGDEVLMRREGDVLILEPIQRKRSLLEVLATMEPCRDVFPEIDDLPANDVKV